MYTHYEQTHFLIMSLQLDELFISSMFLCHYRNWKLCNHCWNSILLKKNIKSKRIVFGILTEDILQNISKIMLKLTYISSQSVYKEYFLSKQTNSNIHA